MVKTFIGTILSLFLLCACTVQTQKPLSTAFQTSLSTSTQEGDASNPPAQLEDRTATAIVSKISQTDTPVIAITTQPQGIVLTPSKQPTIQTTAVLTGNPQTRNSAIIINHNSVELFESIPDKYLTAARETKMMFADRSVGKNIDEGLNCLSANSWIDSPSFCRRDYLSSSWEWVTYDSQDLANGRVPPRILFEPDPIQYNRSNWIFEFHQGSWGNVTQDFVERLVPQYLSSTDVLSYQLTYLHVDDQSNIMDPEKGFFVDNQNTYDIYDLQRLINAQPNRTIIIWTTSLARGIGTKVSSDFNNQLRNYAIENNLILFDVADIEAHTPEGGPCYDNRDAIEYCGQGGKCENYPDDGLNLPAICQDYTTETDGGHLGSVSAGKIRIAKAMWVLMARITGWDGNPK